MTVTSRLDSSLIAFIKCQVKVRLMGYQAGNSGEFEIVASNCSRVEKSPHKKFQLSTNLKSIDPECESVPVFNLKDLEDVTVNQCVTVLIKVVGVEDQRTVMSKAGKKLIKQECSVAEATRRKKPNYLVGK